MSAAYECSAYEPNVNSYTFADDQDDHDNGEDGDGLIVRLVAVIAPRSPTDRVTC